MIHFRKLPGRVALLSLVALTAACSSLGWGGGGNSKGERMVAEGRAVAALGKTWKDGEAKVKKGNKLIAQGRKLAAKGETNIREGQALLASGSNMASTHRESYVQQVAMLGTATAPADAETEVNQLNSIVRKWKTASGRASDGRSQEDKGRTQLNKGEAMIREGNALIADGRAMMDQAERAYGPNAPGASGVPTAPQPLEPPRPIVGDGTSVDPDQADDSDNLPDRTYGDLPDPAGQ